VKQRRGLIALGALLAASGCQTPPPPARAGDPEEGRRVAQDLCASCHATGLTGESPNAAAPPLRVILDRRSPDGLARDLKNAVQISHMKMPQFYFGDEHAEDLVAYLVRLRENPPAS
jgi:mono/diheme cytochrome c family protein